MTRIHNVGLHLIVKASRSAQVSCCYLLELLSHRLEICHNGGRRIQIRKQSRPRGLRGGGGHFSR